MRKRITCTFGLHPHLASVSLSRCFYCGGLGVRTMIPAIERHHFCATRPRSASARRRDFQGSAAGPTRRCCDPVVTQFHNTLDKKNDSGAPSVVHVGISLFLLLKKRKLAVSFQKFGENTAKGY